ncbi:MAG: hypothetical protein KDD32_01145 [Bacteroidetes bacterium]|nr:hypothetical protein [Bacteroidota bacterium]
MKTLKLFGILFIAALMFNSCSADNISEAEFVGTYTGTIDCVLKVEGESDINLDNLPYTLTITNTVDGDKKIKLADGGLLDGYEVTISGTDFNGSDQQTVTVLDLGDDNLLNNVTFTRSTSGELDGDDLDHSFSVTGTSDEGNFSFVCTGMLTK